MLLFIVPYRRLRGVVVQIDFFDLCNDLAVIIVAAGTADVVGTLKFTAAWAFLARNCFQRVVRAAHIAFRARDPVLLDCHHPPQLFG